MKAIATISVTQLPRPIVIKFCYLYCIGIRIEETENKERINFAHRQTQG